MVDCEGPAQLRASQPAQPPAEIPHKGVEIHVFRRGVLLVGAVVAGAPRGFSEPDPVGGSSFLIAEQAQLAQFNFTKS